MGHKLRWEISLLIFLAACALDQPTTLQTPTAENNTPTPTVTSVPSTVPTTTSPTPSTDNPSGLIAFYSDRDGDLNVYLQPLLDK